MTYNEFLILVKAMKSVYTRDNFLPDSDSIKIWYQMLQDIDYRLMSAAIQKWMLTNKFPPTIAELREMSSEIKLGETPEWGDGWEQVLRAVKMYGAYRQKEALESMDEITRRCVERMGFQNICMSENISVERANFRMIFENMSERKKREEQIPAKLLQRIKEIRNDHLLSSNEAARIETKG